ncbi:MAG: asparagine--tRNA ligase [Myxococcota bacterium]|jgi:asparaginyl-tRNA synthetase|nr:asparagine--tRNA ligase [Myxococcota bacterium]
MQSVRIADVAKCEGQKVTLQGWLYNKRSSKKLHFLQVRDGSAIIQAIASVSDVGEELFAKLGELTQETSLRVQGTVVKDERSPLGFELHLNDMHVVSESPDYPITKKAHGDAFLMDHRHLWLRSKRQHVILRIRHTIIKAIRDYLDENDFVLVDSPIFTPNACEGTSTLFDTDYFGQKAYLTQSGQLYQEAAALAFGKSYCFGPTFRAEKSKTRRHLTEFWMVEPEVAYMELEGLLNFIEDTLCVIVERVLNKHESELENVLERDLTFLRKVQKPFIRLSYDDAVTQIKALQNECDDPEVKELLDIEWGMDFGGRHETELTKCYDRPILVHGFPTAIKAFYMKRDPNRPEVSCSVDCLAPEGYGEIVGGGQREDRLDVVEASIAEHDLPQDAFEWFLDLRRYGSVPHAGFGLGVERTVAWICGLHHVRETIPFARTMDRLGP